MNFVRNEQSQCLTLHEVSRLPEFKIADCKPEVHCISGLEWHIAEIPTATPAFSTMLEPMVIQPTLYDVGRLLKFRMADCKPEVHCIFGIEWHITEIPTATRTFSTLSKSMVTLPTLPNNMKILETSSFINGIIKLRHKSLLCWHMSCLSTDIEAESSVIRVRTTATEMIFLTVTTANKVSAFTVFSSQRYYVLLVYSSPFWIALVGRHPVMLALSPFVRAWSKMSG
jgi:hypothetical protein